MREDYNKQMWAASFLSVAWLAIAACLAGWIAESARVGCLVFFGGLWFGAELGETSLRICDVLKKRSEK